MGFCSAICSLPEPTPSRIQRERERALARACRRPAAAPAFAVEHLLDSTYGASSGRRAVSSATSPRRRAARRTPATRRRRRRLCPLNYRFQCNMFTAPPAEQLTTAISAIAGDSSALPGHNAVIWRGRRLCCCCCRRAGQLQHLPAAAAAAAGPTRGALINISALPGTSQRREWANFSSDLAGPEKSSHLFRSC